MNRSDRPRASVSLDLDNLWSYLKTHGDSGWEERPTYLPTFCPLVVEELDRLGLRVTFFVVGADAVRSENQGALELLTEKGHEVGNHSFEHDPWLHTYPRSQLEEEIFRAHEAIREVTGEEPVGFRGPGFSWSPALLDVLSRRYTFDASTLPTFLGPVARTYYLWTTDLPREEKEKRKKLFGTFKDGFRPVKPYLWDLGGRERLLEIPVSTIPGVRTPFHLSYLLYLARYSEKLMEAYLGTALSLCRWTGLEPSFLLHPLDLLGPEDVSDLAFFPGMDLPRSRKIDLFRKVLRKISAKFRIIPMSEHARSLLAAGNLTVIPGGLASDPT